MRNFSENMQQIYKRTPKQKCEFNKVALYLHALYHTSAWVFSSKFAAYFRTFCYKSTFEQLSSDANGDVLVSLLLTLSKFYTLS